MTLRNGLTDTSKPNQALKLTVGYRSRQMLGLGAEAPPAA